MKNAPFLLLAVFVWLAVTGIGTWAMIAAANVPGEAAAATVAWPSASRLPRPVARPLLVIFVHPKCPCSRASLGELAILMSRCAGQLEARAIFVDPVEDGDDSDARTDLWRTAAAIPGVAVLRDAGGREARAFDRATSGDTLLYAADGRLVFQGGITLARGHAGDNPGRDAIEKFVRGIGVEPSAAPVFGCGLFAETQRGTSWKR